MDLSSLSVAELRRLQTKVETEIRRRSDTAKKDLLKRMQKLAAEHGMSLNEVIGQEADKAPAAAPAASPRSDCPATAPPPRQPKRRPPPSRPRKPRPLR